MNLRKKRSKLKTGLLIVAAIGTSLFPITARSNDLDTCIEKGQKALADQDKVIVLKTRTIEAQDKIIAAQDTQITKLADGQSIFKSPLLYTIVGLVVGGFIVARVR